MTVTRLAIAVTVVGALWVPVAAAGHQDLGARALDMQASATVPQPASAIERLIAQERARGDDPAFCLPGCAPAVVQAPNGTSVPLPAILAAVGAAAVAAGALAARRRRAVRPAPVA
jgi:hypothetical protein